MNFSFKILDWYKENKRDLPWRSTRNPYYIWLSEIILQQTRVAQGTEYYYKFIDNYPSVMDLAKASEQEILNDWQGLGYYSRARNLHFSAKYITKELNGEFPCDFPSILKLKGVGNYTASAIASFAFDLPYAVVDGNVYRVLSRIFGVETPIDSSQGQKEFQKLADDLLDRENSAEYNQAIMEFGAVQCVPFPDCSKCVFELECVANQKEKVRKLPVKSKKIKQTKRFFHFLVSESKNTVYLEKRTGKGIWQNMYQFPLIETKSIQEPEELSKMEILKKSKVIKHILSHQQIFAQFYTVNFTQLEVKDKWIKFDRTQLVDLPLPRLIDRFLNEN